MTEVGELGVIPAPIGSSFCAPSVTQFKIIKKLACWKLESYIVTDLEGNLLLKFSKSSWICCNQVAYDGQGEVVVSLKKRIFTLHNRWDAYRAKKKDEPQELLFSMEKASLAPWNSKFRIWLAGNGKDEFTLTCNFWESHFKIRHNGAVIAEADLKRRFLIEREFTVTANGGVDQAFIASILVIHREVSKQKKSGGGGDG